MGGRAEKADGRTGIADGGDGIAWIGFGHPFDAMASRIDQRRSIIGSEGRQRPDDVEQKLLALGALPHVMIAVRELPRFARMDLDSLHDIELQTIAAAA